MAFCNIKNTLLGKKLDSALLESNRNKIANLIDNSDFKEWFGKGRVDTEGNPVLDETWSFINDKNQKKTIFDFPDITFENKMEVSNLLASTIGIRKYNNSLFINNTKKNDAGNFIAEYAMRAFKTINYYYPGLLSIRQYQRQGKSMYSKDKSIPLPSIIINEEAGLNPTKPLFSIHDTGIFDGVDKRFKFSQIRSIDAIEELKDGMDQYSVYGLTEKDIDELVDNPEISKVTFDILKSFFEKLSPDTKIETIDNLSTDGAAYIRDLLIQLKTGSELKAMPEEVAHFFVEMLPSTSEMKKDLINNITNFPIYSMTLNTYKSIKEYQDENGNVNYDKIKREAAAKLISEYVYAISSGDESRIEKLTRVKDNFIKKWWNTFVSWIKRGFQIKQKTLTDAYKEAANQILNGKVEYLTMEEITKNVDNGIFFSQSDANKLTMASEILQKVVASNKMDDLVRIVNRFRYDLKKIYIDTLTKPIFDQLRNKLMLPNMGTDTDINHIAILYDLIKDIKIHNANNVTDINDMMDADVQISNLSDFLNVLSGMGVLADSMSVIADEIQNGDDKLANIAQIQAFRNLYSNFEQLIKGDLMRVLDDTGVERSTKIYLQDITTKFIITEGELINKLRNNYSSMLKTILAPQNAIILNTLKSEINFVLNTISPSPNNKSLVDDEVNKYIDSVQNGIDPIKAQQNLFLKLSQEGFSTKDLTSKLSRDIFAKVDKLVVPEQFVDDMLHGMGKDIDPTSYVSHYFTAAIKNHDLIISNVAAFIVNKRAEASNYARIAMTSYMSSADVLIKKLKNAGINEYKAGERITYVDEVNDKSSPTGTRKIVKFLNPTTNDVTIQRDKLVDAQSEAYKNMKANEGTTNERQAKDEYRKARRLVIDFQDRYFNSPYKKEYRDFLSKWNKNEDYLDLRDKLNNISEDIEARYLILERDAGNQAIQNELNELIRERSLLFNDEGKSDEEKEKIKLLKENFEEGKKFREDDLAKSYRNLALAKARYEARIDIAISKFLQEKKNDLTSFEVFMQKELKDPNFKIKDRYAFLSVTGGYFNTVKEALEEDVNIEAAKTLILSDWEKGKYVFVRNEKYFAARDEIMARINELKANNQLSPIDIQITEMYEKISKLLINRKDEYGETNPKTLTYDELLELQSYENRIDALRGLRVNTYKVKDEVKATLDKSALASVSEYENLIEEYNKIFSDPNADTSKLPELIDSIKGYNDALIATGLVNPRGEVIKRTDENGKVHLFHLNDIINSQWKALSELSDKIPTQQYMQKIERLIPILQQIQEKTLVYRDSRQWSTSELALINAKLENLKHILGGVSGTEGIIGAIQNQDYVLLDQMLNNEYMVPGEEEGDRPILIDLKQYLDRDEEGISEIDLIDEEFGDWFHLSHKAGKGFTRLFDDETGTYIKDKVENRDYTRRMYYTTFSPKGSASGEFDFFSDSSEYFDKKIINRYKETKLKGDKNGITDEELGYYQKQVSWKDSNNMEDWTIDNRSDAKYLPMSRKQRLAEGNTDSTYLNQDFYNLNDSTDSSSKTLKEYLDLSVRTLLSEQEGKADNIKSMFNLPVTSIEDDPYLKKEAFVKDLPDRIKRGKQLVQSIFTKVEDIEAEDMLKGLETKRDVDEISQKIINNKLPALGMNSKLPVERVNRNVLKAVTQYISSSKDYDARVDLMPFVKGLLDVMKANEKIENHQSQKKRTEIFDKIYSQMILEETPDNITNLQFFKKTVNRLLGLTSMKLVFDLTGGAINYVQANINNMIEVFSGKHVSSRNYAIGYAKASQMMANLFVDFNKKSDFGYWTMLYQTMDFIQGEFVDDLLDRTSSKGKKFDWHAMAMYPRTNGELHAQSAMGIAMMDRYKIKNQIDGKVYPMWDIYKKDGDKLVLKDGFWEEDESGNKIYPWNPNNGSKFLEVRNLIWSVNIDLHGNYAKLNQTEASRHSIGKLAENLKRWFVSGFQRRMGRESFDVNSKAISEGFYSTAFNALMSFVRNLITFNMKAMKNESSYFWKTPRKRQNLLRFGAESMASVMLFMFGSLLGYDNDDPNKNKKLKENSWFQNELILIAIRTYAEQTSYIPVPPFGFTEMTRNLLDPFSVAKSTLGNVVGMGTLAMYHVLYALGVDSLKDDLFYQKNTGSRLGKKGDSKFIHYFLKSLGYSGAMGDPAYYIRNFQSLQNRLK